MDTTEEAIRDNIELPEKEKEADEKYEHESEMRADAEITDDNE